MELVNTAQKFSFSFSKLSTVLSENFVNIKHIKWNWISSMKFETVRIYLVEWRFWFVVWSKNFATVANISKKTTTTTTLHVRSTLFCTFLWRCFARLQCETLCWNMSYVLTICFVGFLFTFFYSAAHFHLVGRFFSFSHRQFPCFRNLSLVFCLTL